MKAKLLLILLVSLFPTLSGCWDKVELNELGIVTAVSIDKADDTNGFIVTVQLLNPSEIASQTPTTRVTTTTYQAEGQTVLEAIHKLSKVVSRRIYFAHLRVIIFGNDLAKEGIRKTLDYFYRDHELRSDFYILVAKNDDGADILNILTPLEKIAANKIYGSLQYSHTDWAPTRTVTIDQLLNDILTPGKEPVLTGIEITGDKEIGPKLENVERSDTPATLKLTDLAVFKGDKLIGWLNDDQSTGYNKITNNVEKTVDYVKCDGGKITFELSNLKSKIKSKMLGGEQPEFTIHLSGEGDIGDVECNINLNKPETIYKLEKQLDAKMKKLIISTIKSNQENFKSDIFGFGETLHRQNPKVWAKLGPKWDELFVQTSVKVDVDIKIRRLGTITKSIQ